MKKLTKKDILSMARIVDMYIKDEKRHWEEWDKPKDHIYHDLIVLRSITLKSLFK